MLSYVIRTYVFAPHGVRPPDLGDKFCGVEANLDDVVQQGECRRQREGGDEQRHKPVLDYYKYQNTHASKDTLLNKKRIFYVTGEVSDSVN